MMDAYLEAFFLGQTQVRGGIMYMQRLKRAREQMMEGMQDIDEEEEILAIEMALKSAWLRAE
ncbi:hypothetical protein HZB02_03245 [Candidatus Woesearchaeota archaeon]|nr:hypothetical protein [Candidatus Woesearchaeota archaeon]